MVLTAILAACMVVLMPLPAQAYTAAPVPVLKPVQNYYNTTTNNTVALTFDDGPSPYTPQILDLLKANNIKATFCIIGSQAVKYPQYVRRIYLEHHTLCNHSWNHSYNLHNESDAAIKADMQRASQAIKDACQCYAPLYFRAPGGYWASNVIRVAASLKMASLNWAVDPKDWSRPGTQTIINRVKASTKSNSIVLSHDGGGDRSQTVAAYKTLLPYLHYKFAVRHLHYPL
jgi:peptidoglycan/xylan/chitin deacetylase (PgdA/CDA1 family)